MFWVNLFTHKNPFCIFSMDKYGFYLQRNIVWSRHGFHITFNFVHRFINISAVFIHYLYCVTFWFNFYYLWFLLSCYSENRYFDIMERLFLQVLPKCLRSIKTDWAQLERMIQWHWNPKYRIVIHENLNWRRELEQEFHIHVS